MSKDRRSKGCPNEKCAMHVDKKKLTSDNNFCPKCGAALIYVCSKCFTEIEDLGESHRICKLCAAEIEARKEKAKETVKNVAAKVGATGVAVVTTVVAAAEKEGLKRAADVGAEAVKKAAEVVPKIIKK